MSRLSIYLVLLAFTLAACDAADPGLENTDTDPTTLSAASAGLQAVDAAEAGLGTNRFLPAGAVFTLSNAPEGNAVLVFNRAANGRLTAMASYATGGDGDGAGLNGTSNPIDFSDDRDYLFTVNGGSNTISVFRLGGRKNLKLVGTTPSGGVRPISLDVRGDHLYVVHADGGGVAAFEIGAGGSLTHINAQDPGFAAAAQVGVSPDGGTVVATDRGTDTIYTFAVEAGGALGAPVASASAAPTPFGFAFTPGGVLVVSEAVGGAADASVTSSYHILPDGTLSAISTVPTTESAACWAEVSPDGRFAYVTNTGSGSVTGYSIGNDGALALLDADGETALLPGDAAPVDAAFAGNAFLYVHDSRQDQIVGFAVDHATGALTEVPGAATGLPGTSIGVAAL